MSFRCDEKTLERLEWPRLAERLAREAATVRGAEACRGDLFAPTHEAARERLAETSEVRGLLDAGEDLPLGGVHDLREMQAALRRGALLTASDLAQVYTTVQAGTRVRAFLRTRDKQAPRLSALAQTLPELGALERELARVLTPEGELRDDASPELKRVRRRVLDLERDVQRRMSAFLQAPELQRHLQDHYVTLRENRPVLPVRADARQHVRGIVHDVSSSGTTVFIEPESVVEVSNQLRLAQLALTREMERLLRELGEAVDAEYAAVEALGTTLETLDVARARGGLSRRLDAAPADTGPGVPFALRELRHPLLRLEAGLKPEEVVPNDLVLPSQARGLVISGPNAGGKTVLAKAAGLAALSLRAGLHVAAAPDSTLPILDGVFADIGDEQDLRSGLSTFSARMSNLAGIVEDADASTLVIVDEVGEGTEPGEGASLAQAILESLVERGAFVIATTHFNRLKELAGNDERFVNASAEFDVTTLLPTYRVQLGVPGSSGAIWVAERMGLSPGVVERAQVLLDHEDRKLETLTRGLSTMRQELEAERQAALRTREESEAVRAVYEKRLSVLRSAREKALAAMKDDLELAFRHAREELAEVMRAVQRGSSRDGTAANRARAKLAAIQERTKSVERGREQVAPRTPIDPEELEPGAQLALEGIAGEAVLLEGPDRHQRLVVRMGGARMTVPLERVLSVRAAQPAEADRPVQVERVSFQERGNPECDLRGLRVDEALDRADAHLQRMLGTSIQQLVFIHGHGTGALREAVREWLGQLSEVTEFKPGDPRRGGNGVTVATLAR